MKYLTLLFGLFLLFSCDNEAPQVVDGDYWIEDVSVIPIYKDTLLEDCQVILKGNKIVYIGAKEGVVCSDSIQRIDGKGKFLMPGLADMHVHLPEAEAERKQFFTLQMMAGVTKLRSMRGAAYQVALKAAIEAEEVVAPKLYLASQAIFPNVEFTAAEVDSLVAHFKAVGYRSIKILGVDRAETLDAFAAASKKYELPLCGHSSRNLSLEKTLNTEVYLSIEHLGGYLEALDSSEAYLMKMIDLTLQKGVYNCATIDYYNTGRFSLDELERQAGLEYVPQMKTAFVEQYQEQFGGRDLTLFKEKTIEHVDAKLKIVRAIFAKGGQLLLSPDGTGVFSVPGFSLWREMKLHLDAGLSNYDILKVATLNAANYLEETSFGTIEVGKEADLLLLNQNPLENIENIAATEGIFLRGNYLSLEALKAQL